MMPVPMPARAPERMAEYAPGLRLTRIADSSGLEGARPADWSCAALAADCQLSLVAITAWSDDRTSVSVGLASGLAMPNCASDGPDPTTATVLVAEPPTTKPPIITSLPVSTRPRAETLPSRPGSPRPRG